MPGGVLPRPSAEDPHVADLLVAPGTTVHAVSAGTARRAAAELAPGALELHASDGTTIVYTGPAAIAWAVDDEEVLAGAVLGVVAGADHLSSAHLLVLAIDAHGVALDAVDLLVGLPDPSELGLDAATGLGTDPYRLDLEIARGPRHGGSQ